MKEKFDLKSVSIGIVAGVLLSFALSATSMPSGPVGRFQITVTEQQGFVIDTTNGRVWNALLHRNGPSNPDFLKSKISD